MQTSSDTPTKILEKARAVDKAFGITFSNRIPDLIERDVWLETVYVCRGSFAVASIIAPPDTYGNDEDKKAPFDPVLKANPQLLKDVNRVAMHDAVLNVAITWKYLWNRLK